MASRIRDAMQGEEVDFPFPHSAGDPACGVVKDRISGDPDKTYLKFWWQIIYKSANKGLNATDFPTKGIHRVNNRNRYFFHWETERLKEKQSPKLPNTK